VKGGSFIGNFASSLKSQLPSASALKAALLEKRIAKEREQRVKVQKRLEDELERVKMAVTEFRKQKQQ
jgi:hypothetical protein